MPENQQKILSALDEDHLIVREDAGTWAITNLGAVLFAVRLKDFRHLQRKAIRVIIHQNPRHTEHLREMTGNKGYAVGFNGLIGSLKILLPAEEVMDGILRREVETFPEPALRELIANALIHQDFSLTGTGPMIEVFDDRVEITNPGTPLVAAEDFLHTPPRSRNEGIASLMRRTGFCEERGSGIRRVVWETELHRLPPPLFETWPEHTRSILFAHRTFREMDRTERLRACYFHCVLKYLNRKELMSNTSLRERFDIEAKNSAMISRVIKQALEREIIKPRDTTVGNKAMRYVPIWA